MIKLFNASLITLILIAFTSSSVHGSDRSNIGDLDNDTDIDYIDIHRFNQEFDSTSQTSADFDNDNDVDIFDLSIQLTHFSHQPPPTPTPTHPPTPTPTPPSPTPAISLNKKVYMLIYDPILHTKGGVKLSEYKNWNHHARADNSIDFFKKTSNGYVNFSIAKKVEVNDVWLTKIDGFTYTEKEYLEVVDHGAPEHRPDIADYNQFLNNPELDICGYLNRGEIDELWIFGGPWFGFYESAMASNDINPGFWVNGPTFNNTTCKKLLPVGIPGPHTFGHRAEATMTHVYGDWQQNRQLHRWDMFGLERAHSPDFNSYGCGSVHYTPNSKYESDDYEYTLPYNSSTYCDAFSSINDIKIHNLSDFKKPITCQEWGCSNRGYETWWWSHLPNFPDVGSDGKLNNWWSYIFDPNIIPTPKSGSFSNLSATFPEDGPATFNFNYSGTDKSLKVHISTISDMSADVYLSFAQGSMSPIIEPNPAKWDKYACDHTLYWQIESSLGIKSNIVSTKVDCD